MQAWRLLERVEGMNIVRTGRQGSEKARTAPASTYAFQGLMVRTTRPCGSTT